MGAGPSFAFGIQRMLDQQQRFARAGHPVYLRLRNFPDPQASPYAGLGFSISPTGSAVGTTDVPIDPPPGVCPVSLHNIGMSMGKLRFGARIFQISATFSDSQVAQRGLSDERQVWNGSDVVGLVEENLLYSIEDIRPCVAGGKTIMWKLTCNANEVPVTGP